MKKTKQIIIYDNNLQHAVKFILFMFHNVIIKSFVITNLKFLIKCMENYICIFQFRIYIKEIII